MKPVLVNPYHEDIERVRHRKFLNMTVATASADRTGLQFQLKYSHVGVKDKFR